MGSQLLSFQTIRQDHRLKSQKPYYINNKKEDAKDDEDACRNLRENMVSLVKDFGENELRLNKFIIFRVFAKITE